MLKNDLTVLALTAQSSQATAAAKGTQNNLAPGPIERLLALLQDFVAVLEPADEGTLHESLDQCHRLMASITDPTTIPAAIDNCNDVCTKILATLDRQQIEQKDRISTLVDTVREALAVVGGGGKSFNKSLCTSMERFEGLVHISDVRQLKVQLLREIGTARQLAEERQKSWEDTCAKFSQRVDALERQLIDTQEEASLDSLTCIANRRSFVRACKERLAASHTQFVLGVIDVDHFKTINDSYGHAIGDRALVAVAAALRNSLRQSDVVARIGGDEFAMLASALSLRQAESRLRMLNASLSGMSFQGVSSPLKLTVSCGVAECSAGDTVESLMERADAALYQAKKLGRNRVVSKETATLRDLLTNPRT